MTTTVQPTLVAASGFPDANQLRQWQAATDNFDGGFRPTGSVAHEGYIQWLGDAFQRAGASVTFEDYPFEKWATPTTCSLELTSGADPMAVPLASYIPWSGHTDPAGTIAQMIHVPDLAAQFERWDRGKVSFHKSRLKHDDLDKLICDFFKEVDVVDKIVVVDVPRLPMPIGVLAPEVYFKNDPDNSLGPTDTVDSAGYIFGMAAVIPAIQFALHLFGAKGMVAVLDLPEELARGAYYPYLGIELYNIPGVYVDREVGARLKNAISASGGSVEAKLVLDAKLSGAVSKHVIARVLGADGTPDIVVGSHTDGTNSIEDNGPAAMLAMATYFAKMPQAERPISLRFVLTSGHFAGSMGMRSYIFNHWWDLLLVRAIIEIEHLGALEWAETSPGRMSLTGKVEPQFLFTNFCPGFIFGWDSAQPKALLNRSIDLAKKLPRSLVTGPSIVGEGLWFHWPELVMLPLRPYPSIQFISSPSYLLCRNLPDCSATTILTARPR
jgi:hypothetical protein